MTITVSNPGSRPRPNLISAALAGAVGLSGLIHCLLIPDHYAVSTVFGLGFLAAAVTQIGLAAIVLLRPRTWVYAAVIGVSVVLMGLYAFNVAVGLPFHAAHTESSEVADAESHGTEGHHGTTDVPDTDDDDAGGHRGDEGLTIGPGEPVDAWGATTQAAQLASVGFALMLIRRPARLAPLSLAG